jgi:hypothetical protein
MVLEQDFVSNILQDRKENITNCKHCSLNTFINNSCKNTEEPNPMDNSPQLL